MIITTLKASILPVRRKYFLVWGFGLRLSLQNRKIISAPDKEGNRNILGNIFLMFPWKCILWSIIRTTWLTVQISGLNMHFHWEKKKKKLDLSSISLCIWISRNFYSLRSIKGLKNWMFAWEKGKNGKKMSGKEVDLIVYKLSSVNLHY